MKGNDAKHCSKCIYHGIADGEVICDHIGLTQETKEDGFRSRVKLKIPYGVRCTLFEEGERGGIHPLSNPNRVIPSKPFDEKRAFELWRSGLTDIEICNAMDSNVTRIQKWRRKSKLQANRTRNFNLSTSDFLEQYNKGLTDTQIACVLGFSPSKIGDTRKNLGLVSNYRP